MGLRMQGERERGTIGASSFQTRMHLVHTLLGKPRRELSKTDRGVREALMLDSTTRQVQTGSEFEFGYQSRAPVVSCHHLRRYPPTAS